MRTGDRSTTLLITQYVARGSDGLRTFCVVCVECACSVVHSPQEGGTPLCRPPPRRLEHLGVGAQISPCITLTPSPDTSTVRLMPVSIDFATGTITFVGGADDDQAGLRFRVNGDTEDRVVILVDGSVLTGDGSTPATADFATAASDSADAAATSASDASDSADAAALSESNAAASETAVSDLLADAAALDPDLDETTALNATFSDTEVEAILDAHAVKINAIITALGGAV
jgi:hypothetical protein